MRDDQYAAQSARISTQLKPSWQIHRLFIISGLLLLLVSCGENLEIDKNANNNEDRADVEYLGDAARGEAQDFKREFWNKLSLLGGSDKCGSCHTSEGSAANYPFLDFADVNNAYRAAIANNDQGQPIVDLQNPSSSRVVQKMYEDHECWADAPDVCASIIETYIDKWLNGSVDSAGRTIKLSAPLIVDVGKSKNFPATATDNGENSFEQTIYPILKTNCSACHSDSSKTPQSPFFANVNENSPADAVKSAYDAARSKIDLDIPENSRFVTRIEGLHNCWSDDCALDAGEMLDAINAFSGAISLSVLDETLLASKAMSLNPEAANKAVLASGGSRYEDNQIALWEFKTGKNNTAYDTSGVEPAMDLTLGGAVTWVLGYGINISAGGFARAETRPSSKLKDNILDAYSIEAWLIPGNVSQEKARIISYSGSDTARNFSMSQTMYNYEFFNRSEKTDKAGEASLMTNPEDKDLQSSLQHVVMTFDSGNGLRIYVNGVFTGDEDESSVKGGKINDWNDNYTFVLGDEFLGKANAWSGKIRMVAIHNSALTEEQIQKNYAVGVGQKYFMLFSVAELLDLNDAYILFEVEQYDDTAYLFTQPRFISLDNNYQATADIPIKGMRIGVNGRETISGQVYGNIDVLVNAENYTAEGQLLSPLGTVVALEKGPETDEFFLTFDQLGDKTYARVEAEPTQPVAADDPTPVSDIGVKTFDEINASMSAVTGIPVTEASVAATFNIYKQQLPAVENISAFLSSHQMAVAQMAMSYCNARVGADIKLDKNAEARFFKGFDFDLGPTAAFSSVEARNMIIDPLFAGLMNIDLADASKALSVQPDEAEIRDLLASTSANVLEARFDDPGTSLIDESQYASLITTMQACITETDTEKFQCEDTPARTENIVIAVCAATLGSALTLIQ